jgi:hypothetical protein
MTDGKSTSDGPAADLSRRGFLGAGTAAMAGVVLAPTSSPRSWAKGTASYFVQGSSPNSKFGNVQIGVSTYSFQLPGQDDAETALSYFVLSGVNSAELRGELVLRYMGAPSAAGIPSVNQINQMADAGQKAAAQRQRAAYELELKRFYASPPMEKLASLRKLYEDAGVKIHMIRLPAGDPEAADFASRAVRALGAVGNAVELSEEAARLQGPIAQRHGVKASMHTHAQAAEPGWRGFDPYLAINPAVALEFDLGHYYGSTGKSPIPEIIRLHDRISNFHLKDRAAPVDGGANMPWGLGGTPLPEILRLLHRENYPIVGHIELEYPIPDGSDALREVRKCVDFCRDVLTAYTSPPVQRRPGRAGRPAGAGSAPPSP